jgi:hypothetical protein
MDVRWEFLRLVLFTSRRKLRTSILRAGAELSETLAPTRKWDLEVWMWFHHHQLLVRAKYNPVYFIHLCYRVGPSLFGAFSY